jgi:hypothetical protein
VIDTLLDLGAGINARNHQVPLRHSSPPHPTALPTFPLAASLHCATCASSSTVPRSRHHFITPYRAAQQHTAPMPCPASIFTSSCPWRRNRLPSISRSRHMNTGLLCLSASSTRARTFVQRTRYHTQPAANAPSLAGRLRMHLELLCSGPKLGHGQTFRLRESRALNWTSGG